MLWLIFILLLVSLLYFFSRHLDWGWYILVFLSPLIHWIFYFSKYYYFFTENFPWLLGVYAPVVEFWTLFLFCAYLLYLGRQWARGEAVKIYLPGIGWFLLFVGTALVSLVNVYPLEIFASLWYLLHFIVFFYFGYIVLGANIIKNKKILERSLQILAGMGVLAILMGWASIIFGKWRELYSFPRITPFALGNFAPFGDQHIFLAEILTMVLPIFAYFWYVQRRERKNWLAGGSILVLFTALGTLSRAAWVTVFAEILVLFLMLKKEINWAKVKRWVPWGLVLVPLLVYFGYFLFTSNLVKGSNSARWALTELSWDFFLEHPVIGNGVGTFVTKLSEVKYFNWEFGEAVDAHGLPQKLLAEQGVLGLAAFAIFMCWILRRLYWRYQDERYKSEARLMAFVALFLVLTPLIFQMFNTQYYSSRMWVPIALAIAQSLVYKGERLHPVFAINFRARKKIVEKEIL